MSSYGIFIAIVVALLCSSQVAAESYTLTQYQAQTYTCPYRSDSCTWRVVGSLSQNTGSVSLEIGSYDGRTCSAFSDAQWNNPAQSYSYDYDTDDEVRQVCIEVSCKSITCDGGISSSCQCTHSLGWIAGAVAGVVVLIALGVCLGIRRRRRLRRHMHFHHMHEPKETVVIHQSGPAYQSPSYPQQGYQSPPAGGYGNPQGYGAPSGYSSAPNYGAPPGYGAPPAQGNYNNPPYYGQQQYGGAAIVEPPP